MDLIAPIKYNKNHYVVMANDIVKGKQDMTLQQARIIRLLITQVVKEDRDLKTYSINAAELARFLGTSKGNIYRDIKQECIDLLDLKVVINTDHKGNWRAFHWVQQADYNDGTITLMLSEQIRPFVLELDKWFTQYQLSEVLSMTSFYAIRLYELLKCQEGITRQEKDYHEYSLDELRNYFCCEDKFVKISHFKERVIDISIREINDKTDLLVDAEYIKTGRTITSVRFYIRANYANIKQRNGE